MQTFLLPQPLPAPGGPQQHLTVCTKGYVDLSATSGVDYTPTVIDLLSAPNTRFACWYDWDQSPTGGGAILYEVVGGVALNGLELRVGF